MSVIRTAREMAEDIGRHMSGRSVTAQPYVPSLTEVGYQHLAATANSKALAILPFRFLSLTNEGDSDDRFLEALAWLTPLILALSARSGACRASNQFDPFLWRPAR